MLRQTIKLLAQKLTKFPIDVIIFKQIGVFLTDAMKGPISQVETFIPSFL